MSAQTAEIREQFRVKIEFDELEARALAFACQSIRQDLPHEWMNEAIRRVAAKFLMAGAANKEGLIETYGLDAVVDAAEAQLDEFPDPA